MLTIRTGLLAPLLMGAISSGCMDQGPLRPPTSGDAWIPTTIVAQVDPAAWPRDPATLDSAVVRGDTLRLVVHHRGGSGCSTHAFGLVVSSSFRESHPVQTPALLAHDGHGELCDAGVLRTLRADLSALAEEWRRSYQADTGTIILRLTVGDSTDVPVRYVF